MTPKIRGYSGPDFSDISEWFWSQTISEGDHLIWKGQYSGNSPAVHHHRATYRAYNVAWQLTDGWLPSGYDLRKTCDVPGCITPGHYVLNHPLLRFLTKTEWGDTPPDLDTPCLIWTASTDKDGYGQFRVGDSVVRAHRWIWERLVGPIPDDLSLLHDCDNSSCVNIEHLNPGTHKENMHDMSRRKRARNGATGPLSQSPITGSSDEGSEDTDVAD